MKYTKEVLENAVAQSLSIRGVLKILGCKHFTGGTHHHISKRIKRYGINTSHFLGKRANCGDNYKGGPLQISSLTIRTENEPRVHGKKLKKDLIKEGVPYICKRCGQLPSWNGKELNLTPDHINGKFWDNRKENLEFLCPNCHSQTETFSGRNKGATIPMAEESDLKPAQSEFESQVAHH